MLFRIFFLCLVYLNFIFTLSIVDPGGSSMCLYSGPGSDSGLNEGLVSLYDFLVLSLIFVSFLFAPF